jgi:Cys-tRNA(Pro)/Cys-tRNA(Cys) deacylase
VLAAVRSHDRIDYRKLAKALGVNRKQLKSASPDEIQNELGFQVGGVGPIPLREDVEAIFDSNLVEQKKVCFGSGKNTITVEMDFMDLLEVTGGRALPITREPG